MTISVVQSKSNNSETSSVAVTLDSAVTAGNALIALCVVFATNPGISDNKTNTWVNDTTIWDPAGQYRQAIRSVTSAAAGSTTITLTGDTANHLHVFEVSGLDATPFDKTATGTGTGTSLTTENTAEITVADELLIAMFNAPYVMTEGANWTKAYETKNASYGARIFSEYRIVSSAAAYAATASMGTIGNFEGMIATYKVGAGVASTPINAPFGDDLLWE
jgi:hypothetical protein